MPTALYGSNLDMLGQADIADRDQVLRGRTANQGFLAQLAGERTRRRATEANYDVGLRNQETQRLASQRALDASLAGDLSRMNIADVTSGRGLEGIIANANANKYIADTQGNTSRYTGDLSAETQRRNSDLLREAEAARLAFDREIAAAPKLPSEAMQLGLLGKAQEESARAAADAKLARRANLAAAPSAGSAVLGTIADYTLDRFPLGQTVLGPLLDLGTDIRLSKQNQIDRSQSELRKMEAQGLDTDRISIDPVTGKLTGDPANPVWQMYLERSAPRLFGPPTAVGETVSTQGAKPGKKRITINELRDAASATAPEAPPAPIAPPTPKATPAPDSNAIVGLRGLPF